MLPAGPDAPRLGRAGLAADLALLPTGELVQARDPAHVNARVVRNGCLAEEKREAERALDVDLRGVGCAKALGGSAAALAGGQMGTHGVGELKVGFPGEVEDGGETLGRSAVRCWKGEDLCAGCWSDR